MSRISYYAVGNAAGDGARLALPNADKRAEADEMARKVEYVELTVESDFQKVFTQAMWFPHMKDGFPHLEKLLDEGRVKEGAEYFGLSCVGGYMPPLLLHPPRLRHVEIPVDQRSDGGI